MPKPSKGKVVAVVAYPNSGPKVILQKDGGKLGSPSNRFDVLENFDLASDAALGFVEPIEVVSVSSEPVVVQPGDQLSEVLLCPNGAISSHMDLVSTEVVGITMVPPPAPIGGESSQVTFLASLPTECSHISDVVISLTKGSFQGTWVTGLQVARFDGQDEGISAGLDEDHEPPEVKKKPKKPNKKR
ncbi:hypothetical protein RHMOL_Rhmol06G0081500 [Rhododendron molle]|uniref:Uncharacterized protein n=1 Tax=Rhododendron molle TaxID=49168 RepID=A0ACC0NAV6_RHOML|nr:hypothetical protein RHMOL_Rhmol06G0081500 [Rhododendron molle]